MQLQPSQIPQVSETDLSEQVILVSGAHSDIGRHATAALAEAGATVILLGKRVRELEGLYDYLVKAGCAEPMLLPVDLAGASPDDWEHVAQALESQFGKLDGLVNCASYFQTLTPLEQWAGTSWAETLQINVNAPFMMTQALSGLLRKSQRGRVLFLLNDLEAVTKAYWGAYGVSQNALAGLLGILADELESSQVEVNAFQPAPTRTRLRAKAFPSEAPETLADPKRWQEAFVAMLDSQREFITGKIFQPKVA